MRITRDRYVNAILALSIAFLAWISFFPEPVHGHFYMFNRVFLGLLFLALIVRRDRAIFNRKNLPLWIFLFVVSLNIPSALNKEIAISTYLDMSLTLVFLYFVMIEIFSIGNFANVYIKAICIFSGIVAILGIFEWYLGKNFYYDYIIYNPYYERFIANPIRRPMSTQFNPAPLGSFLLICLPFNFILFKDKKYFFRLLGLVFVILNITVILLTLSRAAFLGLICLLIFYLWHVKKRRLSVMLLATFLLSMVFCSQLQNIGGFDRFGVKGIIYGKHYTSVLSHYRVSRFKMAIRMLKDYPFFGIGLNNLRLRFDQYKHPKEKTSHETKIADNMYLTLLAETGSVGFFGFLVFIVFLFKRGLRNFRRLIDGSKKEILLIAMSSLFGLLVNMGGYELFYWHNPFAMFCILCGIIASYEVI